MHHCFPTLGISLNQSVVVSEINLNSIAINLTPYIPPWVLKSTGFQLSLHLLGNKSEVSPTVYQSKFNELLSQYDGYTRIFTDGSKSGEAVGSAAIVASRVCKKRLPNNSAIFTAEACRILLALDTIHWSTGSQLLFLSDSLSCLQSLQNRDLLHPLIAEILCRVHGLISDVSSVVFMWVPGHV